MLVCGARRIYKAGRRVKPRTRFTTSVIRIRNGDLAAFGKFFVVLAVQFAPGLGSADAWLAGPSSHRFNAAGRRDRELGRDPGRAIDPAGACERNVHRDVAANHPRYYVAGPRGCHRTGAQAVSGSFCGGLSGGESWKRPRSARFTNGKLPTRGSCRRHDDHETDRCR